jgi:parallel beta-helix repeat protein
MKYFSVVFFTIVLLTFSAQTFAVDFTVNLTSNQPDAKRDDGVCDIDLATAELECTLRAAVDQTNILGSNDRILFNLPANSIITLTNTNSIGELVISTIGDTLEIIGTGANNLTIDGGAGTNRIFSVLNTTVIISDVTLTGGNGTSERAFGDSGFGGAVFSEGGFLTLDRVHITGNTASGSGGGVYFFRNGRHRITNSTFSANTAGFSCGGFFNNTSMLTVVNSTISGNTAAKSGGGFCNSNNGSTMLRNVTVTYNTAMSGGGITQSSGMLNFVNTIVAANTAAESSAPEIQFDSGTFTSAGGNLVGDSAGDSTNTGNVVAYQLTDILDTNPILGTLQNNGGTTPTHALLPGSPAINAGNNIDATATDQRGFTRIAGNTVDIGAFEFTPAKSRKRVRFF